ncbi:MAG: glycogen/starch/alpha-glucan phosphorylase [Pseudomonadota bacterium]|nr:glycogen/starch/alpha-glucan phosphorylase [Pseudomonadota bacterium]
MKKATTHNEHTRTGLSIESLERAYNDNLFYLQGRSYEFSTANDRYMAAAYTVRERMLERWIKSAQTYKEQCARTVCYLSAEFLLGPHLGNNMINMGIMEKAQEAAIDMGLDLEEIQETEEEPGLGNGGLGRLAACYMDSLATLQIPAIGYGIRYEFGIFEQRIEEGWQVERTDTWLHNGNPWELPRPKLRFGVGYGGHTEHYTGDDGKLHVRWVPELVVNGMAYDTPVLGYGVNNTNLLRLWKAEAAKSFDFQAFNVGDYYEAVRAKMEAENISKVLYPNDEPQAGKELRLKQQYFFVSCTLQDMIRLNLRGADTLDHFHEKFAVQLNDTHPAIAVPELMRLLMDEHQMSWDKAWDITRRSIAYTNHTLLPEALETWSLELFKRLLPRHLEIIYEINSRFLDEVRIHFLTDDGGYVERMSIIDEKGGGRVRMANLACVGSHAINGVAALHTELLKSTVLRDFQELWPDKIRNVTNGVTPRRFMVLSNPGLAGLLTEKLGNGWIRDLYQLQGLESFVEDDEFCARWREVKVSAKRDLAVWIEQHVGIQVDPTSMFDIQVKRIHEYKRQHLNLLHIVTLYNRIKLDPGIDITPRTFIFGGKAAPGYFMAKLIIKLINAGGDVVNNDPDVAGRLKVVFVPDFSVKRGQRIFPAADLSEQISTAGMEASGTGNMKFSMNGALTIGTLDGANVEIRQEVGEENFFLFGMTAGQVAEKWRTGFNPRDDYYADVELKAAIDLIGSGFFSHGDEQMFRPLLDKLLQHDPFLVLADYRSYVNCQDEVARAFRETEHWTRMSILNVARIGKFSSDRSIRDYCETTWNVHAVPVKL